ncbi:MAG TPA: flagellar motor switch protein FliN [Microbacteriaceae bacterium]|nr:flagellar motor switch protein FliN [Microbacteriaceae bacterium]
MTLNAYEKAAQTLAHAPLFSGPLTVAARPAGAPVPSAAEHAVTARFVGASSSELVVALADGYDLGGASDRLGPADLLRPLLATAAAELGPGTLSDASVVDARDVFADPETDSFAVVDESGGEIAWFAARTLRASAPARAAAADVTGRLSRISNVEMALTVRIGYTRMAVRDVLAIEPGAVIELDRSAGSPADILLNGRLIAHGEIVVVDQDYAVRVTQILDPAEDVA